MSRERFAALLRDAARAGVYHAPQHGTSDLVAAAEANGFAIYRVDLGQVNDKGGFLDRLAKVLGFPDWFGHNWDAMKDCLTDMSWQPAAGYLVLLQDCDRFRADRADDFAAALEVLESAANDWRDQGIAFWTLVDMHPDGIAYLPGIA